jgi:hypothetical protein
MAVELRDEAAMDANVRRFGQEYAEYQTATLKGTATTREDRTFIVVDVPQSMANGSVQHLENIAKDEVRMVISAGCARSEARKVNNQ